MVCRAHETLVAGRGGVSQQSDDEILRFYEKCAILPFDNFIAIRMGIALNDTIQ